MGFFDFFRRRKTPALPEGTKDESTPIIPKEISAFDKSIRVTVPQIQHSFGTNNLFLDPNARNTSLFFK